MNLYYTPGACSLSPHIVLHEAGAAFNIKRVDLGAKKVEDGSDYLKINSRGQVPALQLDNGAVLTEGPAIVQYIADRNPASGLVPAAGTLGRAHLHEWLNYISAEIHKGLSPLFNAELKPEYRDMLMSKISKQFDWLSQQLSGKSYLLNDRFSVADAYLFTLLNWGPWLKFDISQWPVLKAYYDRIAARPKVQEAMKAEGLLK